MGTIATMSTTSSTATTRPSGKTLGQMALVVFEAIERLAARRRSRLALLSLTDDQLKDIGISRADAYREGIRDIWE